MEYSSPEKCSQIMNTQCLCVFSNTTSQEWNHLNRNMFHIENTCQGAQSNPATYSVHTLSIFSFQVSWTWSGRPASLTGTRVSKAESSHPGTAISTSWCWKKKKKFILGVVQTVVNINLSNCSHTLGVNFSQVMMTSSAAYWSWSIM